MDLGFLASSQINQCIEIGQRVLRTVQAGWLTKKGKGDRLFSRRNWCRRWFTVEGRVLTYRKSPDAPDVLGRIEIKQVTDIVSGDDDTVCIQTYTQLPCPNSALAINNRRLI